MSNLKQIFFRRFKILTSSIWAIPVVLIIRLMKPFIKINFGSIITNRIGHFGSHPMLCFVKSKVDNTKDYFWYRGTPSNSFLTKLISRNLNINPWVRYIDFWNKALPFGKSHITLSPDKDIFDFDLILSKSKLRFKFLNKEKKKAKSWLSKKGWSNGQRIVCVLIRDAAYLPNDINDKSNFNYHSYRNSDIKIFEKAILWMANQGAFVIRMGKKQEKPLDTKHKRVYDYAFSKDKSDFLDIWLFANCDLCVSNGTGLDSLSNVYGNPLICVNHLPFEAYYTYKVIMSYKSLFFKKTGKKLNLEEYFQYQNLGETSLYDRSGIKIVDQTPNDILENVKDGWKLIFENSKLTKTQSNQQRIYWDLFFKYNKHVKKIHPQTLISRYWLKKV